MFSLPHQSYISQLTRPQSPSSSRLLPITHRAPFVRSDWGQVSYRSTYLHSRLCPADIFKLHFGCRYLFLRGIIIESRNLIDIL